MPKGFDSCEKRGGRVRTKKLSDNRYIHICFIDGKSFAGEVKHKKNDSLKNRVKKEIKK